MVCASWSKVSAIWLWVNWNVGKLTCWRRDLNDNNIFLWIQIPLAKTKRTRSVRRTKHVFSRVQNCWKLRIYSSIFFLLYFKELQRFLLWIYNPFTPNHYTIQFGFINWIDDADWPPQRVSELAFQALALRQSEFTLTKKLFTVANLHFQLIW